MNESRRLVLFVAVRIDGRQFVVKRISRRSTEISSRFPTYRRYWSDDRHGATKDVALGDGRQRVASLDETTQKGERLQKAT